jgi:hypothetical protein
MAQRGFGGQTVFTGAAQPLFGTTLAAAAVINPDLFTGQIGTGGNRSSAVLSLAAGTAVRFRQGDHVCIGTAAQFQQGNTVAVDGGTVQSVNVAANTITVVGLQRQHASGEFVILALPCAGVTIQIVSASSTNVYVGEDGSVGPTSATLITILSAGSLDQWGLSNIANVNETQHVWVQSGAGGQFIPSILTD